ncbi:hypothetical protein, partial [Macromonas bipunctata]|uniref:hypothetical protein n=1 Tax=Macromonas bipunctata TaxID=183670 RepID=UPI0014767749
MLTISTGHGINAQTCNASQRGVEVDGAIDTRHTIDQRIARHQVLGHVQALIEMGHTTQTTECRLITHATSDRHVQASRTSNLVNTQPRQTGQRGVELNGAIYDSIQTSIIGQHLQSDIQILRKLQIQTVDTAGANIAHTTFNQEGGTWGTLHRISGQTSDTYQRIADLDGLLCWCIGGRV